MLMLYESTVWTVELQISATHKIFAELRSSVNIPDHKRNPLNTFSNI